MRRGALALVAITIVAYLPAWRAGFIWDDPVYVVENPTLRSLAGLRDIWADPAATPQYYPVVHSTFWVEAHLWGTHRAAGFHVVNVLLHATSVLLLWRALVAVGVPWPWLAAAAFAVHPVAVESVAWVTERKNVLSLTFYLLAFHAYRRTGLLVPGGPPVRFRGRKYAVAFLLFLLALLSKTVACSLPAAILLVVYYRRGRITRADVVPLVPFFAAGLALGAMTAHLERTHVGANGPDFDWITPADRVLIAGRAAWFYAAKVAWPSGLTFMYPRWHIDPTRARQWAFPAAAVVVVAGLWAARRRVGRGPLVAVLFFLGTLVPALGFVDVYPMRYSWVADHFQYVAMIGLIPLAVAGLDRVVGRANGVGRTAVAGAVLVPLAVLTWRQQAMYRDAETLWRATVARNDGSWMAHLNLAHIHRDRHEDAAEWDEVQTALRLDPGVADTHYDLGYALTKRGEWAAATVEFRRAVQLSPSVAGLWSTLARALWEHGPGPADATDAVAAARRAVAIDPDTPDANGVLSASAADAADAVGAVRFGQRAVANDPDSATAHARLARGLALAGQPAAAAGEYRRAVSLDARDAAAWVGLGTCQLRVGNAAGAAVAFRRALAVDPTSDRARAGLRQAGGT